jgi:large subunit ribosomal protein L27
MQHTLSAGGSAVRGGPGLIRALSPLLCALPSTSGSLCEPSTSGRPAEAGWQLLQQRSATKKAGGTAKQAGGGLPKNLGTKMSDGELVFPGMIILRQRGTKFHAGQGVGLGRDHTIWATRVGTVRVTSVASPRGERRIVTVEPLPEVIALAAAERQTGTASQAEPAVQRQAQIEAALVQRRAQAKRALLRRFVGLEPALHFSLPTTRDGRLSWLPRTSGNT